MPKIIFIVVVFLYSNFTFAIDPILVGEGPSKSNAPKVLKCVKILSLAPVQPRQELTAEIALYNLDENQQRLALRGLEGYLDFTEGKSSKGLAGTFESLQALVGGWLRTSRKDFESYEDVLLEHRGKALVHGEGGNYKKSKAFNRRYKEGLAIAFLVKQLIAKGLNSAASDSIQWQRFAVEVSESTELLQYGLRIHRLEAGTHILYGVGTPLMWDIPASKAPEKVQAPDLDEPSPKPGHIPSILF